MESGRRRDDAMAMIEETPLPPRNDEPMDGPRRLTRSTSDKYVSGVAGGLGRYFGLDPVLFRVAFGVSCVFGGVGLVAYLALWLFLPRDDGEPSVMENRSKATSVIAMILLACLAVSLLGPPSFLLGPGLLALGIVGVLGVLFYRALGGGRGDDPARMIARATLALLALVAALGAATGIGFIAALGGGTAVAILAVVAGLGLVAAGLLGGPRWLILPVIVLVLPLAVVSAAGIDLQGGVGHRDYTPASVADLRPEYRLGVGEMDLDLRGMTLPAGQTDVKVVVGLGTARVRIPKDLCVSTDAQVGAGETDLPDRRAHGLDVSIDQSAAPREGRPVLHIDGTVGMGYLQVDRDDFGQESKACA
jgi:phage shock protein PspC (stress-responsive transcriptional regulator)